MARAIAGSAASPSTRISTSLPSRGSGGPEAQVPGSASSACSQPIRFSRRRWCERMTRSTRSPRKASISSRIELLLPRAYRFRRVEVGFVGLGAMGGGIARRLLEAGYAVTGWNRTRARAEMLGEAGLVVAESPAAAAAGADVLCTMLTDAAGLESIADQLVAALRPGAGWADLSTIAPDESRALAARVQSTGAAFLDAPVSGSPATLAAGQLSVMVGGDRAAFERVLPVLEAIGPKVTYLGGNGSA